MSESLAGSATPLTVYVVTHLHYRNNDTAHNQASVEGVFYSEAKAISHMNELFQEYIKRYTDNDLPIETDSYRNTRRIVEQAEYEADTDEFRVVCHKVVWRVIVFNELAT